MVFLKILNIFTQLCSYCSNNFSWKNIWWLASFGEECHGEEKKKPGSELENFPTHPYEEPRDFLSVKIKRFWPSRGKLDSEDPFDILVAQHNSLMPCGKSNWLFSDTTKHSWTKQRASCDDSTKNVPGKVVYWKYWGCCFFFSFSFNQYFLNILRYLVLPVWTWNWTA